MSHPSSSSQPLITTKRKRSIEFNDDPEKVRNMIKRREKYARLFDDRVRNNPDSYLGFTEREVRNAYNRTFVDIEYRPLTPTSDLILFMNSIHDYLKDKLLNAFLTSSHAAVTCSFKVWAEFTAATDPRKHLNTEIKTGLYDIFNYRDLQRTIKGILGDILERIDNIQYGRSDWVLENLNKAELQFQFKRPSVGARGGGIARLLRANGRSYIKLPAWVEKKRCAINIDNNDDFCFRYAMECLALLKRGGVLPSNSTRTSKYRDLTSFNYSNLQFPVTLFDLERFEHDNRLQNIAINVFTVGKDKNDVGAIHCSTNIDGNHFDFLLISNDDDDITTNAHWIPITDLGRLLMTTTISNKHGKRVFCRRCCRDFVTQQQLTTHMEDCILHKNPGRAILPTHFESTKSFIATNKMDFNRFVTYADFEAFNMYLDHDSGESKSEQIRVTEHVGASFAFHTVCKGYPEFNNTYLTTYDEPEITSRQLIGKRFINAIEAERDRVNSIFKRHFSYPRDDSQTHSDHDNDTLCCICKLNLRRGTMPHWSTTLYKVITEYSSEAEYRKLRYQLKNKDEIPDDILEKLYNQNCKPDLAWDASKSNDNIIGWAHWGCNRRRPGQPDFRFRLKVMFHNFSKYDSHFILKALNPQCNEWNMKFSGIPSSGDQFMSFSFRNITFIDSFRFINSSLDELINKLRKDGKSLFKNFNSYSAFQNLDDDTYNLLLQKGEFPYEFFSHPSVFQHTCLPILPLWFSKLKNKHISEDDYNRALLVWDRMKCRTFKDYHDLYLIRDVLLLADVFENFRDIVMTQDHLDPTHYVSLPGLAYDSALKYAGIREDCGSQRYFQIELLQDFQEEMYQFLEGSIRGGVSMCPGRYSKANHKYLADYDPTKEDSYIFYLDANNLYGYAMCQQLPIGQFQWLKPSQLVSFDLMSKERDSCIGYILEIDAYFPECDANNHDGEKIIGCHCCHDLLRDFPPAPVNQIVTDEMISPFSKSMNERYKVKHDRTTTKLLCTLEPRIKYRVHYTVLQTYVKLGMKITKIHRILKFAQNPFMERYITFNTEERAKAKTEFEKDFYKLKNNAVYGKFIQNNRKFQDVKVLPKFDPQNKKTYSYGLTDWRIINENFVLGYFNRGKVRLDSAIAVGSVILDHAKDLMYSFFFNVMKSYYKKQLRLLFTDTDSLCVEIKHHDPMKDMYDRGVLTEWFDLALYPKNDSYYGRHYQNDKNNTVIGKMKDEMVKAGCVYITEVVALRSKMYSIMKNDGKQKKTAKGVQGASKDLLSHELYMKCLRQDDNFDVEAQKVPAVSIQSTNNVLHLIESTKISLSPCDSKLYLLDNITTYPFGYYAINDMQRVSRTIINEPDCDCVLSDNECEHSNEGEGGWIEVDIRHSDN